MLLDKRFILFALPVLLLLGSCSQVEPVVSIDCGVSSLPASGGLLSFRVNTNMSSWTYDLGGAEWLSEQKKEDDALYLNVAGNTSESERSATITVFAPAATASAATATLTVKQAGVKVDPAIQAESSFEVPSGGAQLTIPVSTNQASWEAEVLDGADSWISIAPDRQSLAADVAPNPGEDARKATIRLYAPSKAAMTVFTDISIQQEGLVIEYDPEDLSASGSSNCYLISHRGEYSFDATLRGNGSASSGLPAPGRLAPEGARLVWQTAKGMISDLSFADGRISFTVDKVRGSALIAATDASGKILWSWHIWYPQAAVEDILTEGGDRMMNLNLGALDNEHSSISSHGMLYQWGRKDPFPYSPKSSGGSIYTVPVKVYDINGAEVEIGHTQMYATTENNLAFSIANPTVCISNNYQYLYAGNRDWLLPAESSPALWGNPSGADRTNGKYNTTGTKSYYDPCPPGWRVAPVRDYAYMTESGGYTWATGDTAEGLEFNDMGGTAKVAVVDFDGDGKYTLKDFKDGWYLYLDSRSGLYSYFPAATRYDGQYAMLMGSMVGLWGNYWTNTPNTESTNPAGLAVAMSFGIKEYGSQDYTITISPVSNGSRADAYSVRCIKE